MITKTSVRSVMGRVILLMTWPIMVVSVRTLTTSKIMSHANNALFQSRTATSAYQWEPLASNAKNALKDGVLHPKEKHASSVTTWVLAVLTVQTPLIANNVTKTIALSPMELCVHAKTSSISRKKRASYVHRPFQGVFLAAIKKPALYATMKGSSIQNQMMTTSAPVWKDGR